MKLANSSVKQLVVIDPQVNGWQSLVADLGGDGCIERRPIMKSMKLAQLGLAVFTLSLTACGGGGSASTPAPQPVAMSVSISNLSISGLTVTNGVDKVDVPANATSVEFPTKVIDPSKNPVSILAQPSFLTKCELSNAAGTAIACRAAVVTVSKLAGSGVIGRADGTGTAAQFADPIFVATDARGNAYVGDVDGYTVRKITAAGVVTTIAGTGLLGNTNGPAATASFSSPRGIALDAAGNIFVTDTGNKVVRKITPDGVVSTFAGSGAIGSADGVGTTASFSQQIVGIAADSVGNVFVGDYANNSVRKITSAGLVSTLAGNGVAAAVDGVGTAASLDLPRALAVDAVGNVFLTSLGTSNNLIRKITPAGVVTTLKLTFSTANVSFNAAGIAVDAAGNLYTTDQVNHRVNMIDKNGVVTTIAGLGTAGKLDGPGLSARFNAPIGIAIDSSGNLLIGEPGNFVVRKISAQ